MNCIVCGKKLSDGVDTFGPVNQEMCWECWSSLGDDSDMPDSWYGLAPHDHAYDANGQIIIGGTTFKSLPKPDQNGDYIIGNLIFTPDPDAPGCGIWSRK